MVSKKRVNLIVQQRKTLEKLPKKILLEKVQKLKIAKQDSSSYTKQIDTATALICELLRRELGIIPYWTQILAALEMLDNNIVEMATGEGKTITAIITMFLSVINQRQVILFTQNDYLAQRDYEYSKSLFQLIGIDTAVVHPLEETVNKSNYVDLVNERQNLYDAHIVYTTSSVFGFDYLQANLVSLEEERLKFKFDVALIDEVDSILLDSARTPLVISGGDKKQSNYFKIANRFVRLLAENEHYELDLMRGSVWLTYEGIKYAERFYRVKHLFTAENVAIVKHILLALRANYLFNEGEDYVLEEGEVKLLDVTSGRIMKNSILENGLHQAIEAKENVKITKENRTLASITLQNMFRKFSKITGMTGTARTSREEFISLYNLKVKTIPHYKKNIRKDLPDQVYPSLRTKYQAIENRVLELQRQGRAVLLITESITSAEIYSQLFWAKNIEHSLLTASQNAKEADIIALAGMSNNITIATIIAGRGTDIRVSEAVNRHGGLAVVATEHFETKRIDNQVRGRTARQGDPGTSEFYISLEDKIFEKYPQKRIMKLMQEDNKHLSKINQSYLKRLVRKIQKQNEDTGYRERFNALEMDETLRIQREMMYSYRIQIMQNSLQSSTRLGDQLLAIVRKIDQNEMGPTSERLVLDYLNENYQLHSTVNYQAEIEKRFRQLDTLFNHSDELLEIFTKQALLKAVDTEWAYHLERMQKLNTMVEKRVTIQKDPVKEYQALGHQLFEDYRQNIQTAFLKNFMLSRVKVNRELQITFP